MEQKNTVIVIPAYNEQDQIVPVLEGVKKYGQVLVVDDGSEDNTYQISKKITKTLRLPVNMGVGFATKEGIDYAIKKMRAKTIVTIDSDGQHPPEEVEELLKKIGEGFDVVFANRLSNKKQMPISKKIGNFILSMTTNLIGGSNVTDTQCGLRAFTTDAYSKLNLTADDYSFVSEFVIEVSKKKLRYIEVDIPTLYHAERGYKGTTISTGIKIFLRTLLFTLKR